MKMEDLDQIDQTLASGQASRELLIEIVSNGVVLPPLAKAAVTLFITQMSEEQIQQYSKIAHESLSFVKNKDVDGLVSYLRGVGIPAPLLQVLLNYASTNPA